jgi:hypothetical protein
LMLTREELMKQLLEPPKPKAIEVKVEEVKE